jgi:hypothetical protein
MNGQERAPPLRHLIMVGPTGPEDVKTRGWGWGWGWGSGSGGMSGDGGGGGGEEARKRGENRRR